ncbi:hypothetical protein [Nocardia brasiliensis]
MAVALGQRRPVIAVTSKPASVQKELAPGVTSRRSAARIRQLPTGSRFLRWPHTSGWEG